MRLNRLALSKYRHQIPPSDALRNSRGYDDEGREYEEQHIEVRDPLDRGAEDFRPASDSDQEYKPESYAEVGGEDSSLPCRHRVPPDGLANRALRLVRVGR